MAEAGKSVSPPLADRPLVTFALFAYNNEKYIREAVEGALAQTYEPLEIILSDDCSTDSTFEIMLELIADYGGPHQVVLNRNTENLGIGGHVNKIDASAKGDLIIHAAGDDISLPQRVDILTVAWLLSDRPSAIWSNASYIGEDGSSLGGSPVDTAQKANTKIGADVNFSPLGATLGLSRRLVEQFGPFDSSIFCEDMVIAYRALISGGIRYIESSLVLYRQHQSISNYYSPDRGKFLDHYRRWAECRLRLVAQRDCDRIKVGLQEEAALIKSPIIWWQRAIIEITGGSLWIALVRIARHFFTSPKEARHLFWLWLVRVGLKGNIS